MERELATKLESSGIQYQTQFEVTVTTADFYFATELRLTVVFMDGRPHLTIAWMIKEEELRTLLRKRGYNMVEFGMQWLLRQESWAGRRIEIILPSHGELSSKVSEERFLPVIN
jgi:hypothetical protein